MTMRNEVRAAIASTRFQPDGKLETRLLVEALTRADRAWRSHGMRKKWLREDNFFAVYLRFLSEVAPHDCRSAPDSRSLADMLGAVGAQKLEDELVRFMESVPRRYLVEFPIRTTRALSAGEVRLSDTLALIQTEIPASQSGYVGLGAITNLLNPNPGQTRSQVALRVPVLGYIDDDAEDSAAQAAISMLKRFLGMGYAGGFVGRDGSSTEPFDPSQGQVTDITDESETKSNFVLPPATAGLLRNLVLVESALRLPTTQEKLAHALTNKQQSQLDRPRLNLQRAVAILGPDHSTSNNLRAASEWLFDTLAEQNQTTALLFASIGLEAALDAPKQDSTNRLADRLAWMLGRSHEERRNIESQYRDFYAVRSDLVHGRERTLDEKGREKLRWGREMLRDVTARELEQQPIN
jgi:hypothetical protein